MRPPAFRTLAARYWEAIPARFRDGATLLVHPEAMPDADDPEVFLLGACEGAFEALEDAFAMAGDLRPGERQSLIHIWYGSFQAMAERAVRFDWAGELEETILHELTHHWEGRAGLDGLDRFDAAQILNFQRRKGLAVPFGYWRDGERLDAFRWHIDGDVFSEVEGLPPWTVAVPGRGRVTCSPDPALGYALLPGAGLPFDGVPGDLIIAPRPPERPSAWQRLWRWLRRKDEETP
ncbi:MAG: metallopeptidase family protein [Myxococcales bacterium]|nr:metallopeptidase family protein [Myxococcales bacterium]